jgi:[acyl-carrier-protein] S-malonyltransferase
MTHFQLGMVFPGQGSQSVGMLTDIATEFSEVAEVFTEAADILHEDLWRLAATGPSEQLDMTVYTQPILLAASYAIWRILNTRGAIKPDVLAGHSLGEYTALVCAGALSFSDAILLVAARGKYMQEAVPSGVGAMAAIIGLEENQVSMICEQALQDSHDIVSAANFNSIGQIVIAGHLAPVERAMELAKKHGAKMAVLIPVSVPSHCLLMQGAANQLAILLKKITFTTPHIPVISNVNVTLYQTDSDIREGLTQQLYQPVRWLEIIQWFVRSGVTHVIECGPGKVLTGLSKRINKSLQLSTTFNLECLKNILQDSERVLLC